MHWSTSTGAFSQPPLDVTVAPPDEFKSSSLSRDGGTLCVVSRNATTIWDVASRRRRAEFEQNGPGGIISVAALAPNGVEFAAGYEDGGIAMGRIAAAVIKPTQVLTLKSAVRAVRFAKQDSLIAIDLLPNAPNEEDPAYKAAYREGLQSYSQLEQKLLDQESTYTAIRSQERSALIQRVQRANAQNAEDVARLRDAALVKFDAETKKALDEKFGKPKRRALAALYEELRQKFAAEAPWDEVAAIWKPGAPSTEMLISQPVIDPDKLPTSTTQPATQGASLFGMGSSGAPNPPTTFKWPQAPHSLLAESRLVWFDRQEGAVEVDLGSQESAPLKEPDLEVKQWLLSPDGNQLFIQGTRNSKREVTKENGFGNPVSELVEKKTPVCGLYDFQTQKLLPLTGMTDDFPASQPCFTSDSKRLIAIASPNSFENESRLHRAHQFDVSTGNETGAAIGYPDTEVMREMAVSPDGKWLAMVRGENAALHLIDLASGKERPTTLSTELGMPTFSPDSKLLAIVIVGSEKAKHSIEVLDIATGQVKAKLTDWSSSVYTMAFSPDSRVLAIGGGGSWTEGNRDFASMHYKTDRGGNGELKLYDSETGELHAALAGHADVVSSLDFSSGGDQLASGGFDRRVKIWDVKAALYPAGAND